MSIRVSQTQGYDRANALSLEIVQMGSENEIVDVLIGSSEAFGFDNARYYDANRCPFRKCHFYVLRATSREYEHAKPGYRIYDPTMSDQAAIGRMPVWEEAGVDKAKGDSAWVDHLKLRGHEWIDVPIFAGGHILGLWALNRPKRLDTIERENISSVLKGLAGVAGLKIHELRQERIAALSGDTFNYSFELSHSGNLELKQQYSDLLKYCLSKTCQALNAATLAYFQFDPFENKLQKKAEIHFDGEVLHDVTNQLADRTYQRGMCLTGVAWDDESFRHIPDFLELQKQQPNLVNDASLKLHEDLLGQGIQTVVYERVHVPGGLPGFLRAINRADEPALTFTGEHCDLLHRIALPFGQVLGTIGASARQATIASAFTETVKELQQESFSYKSLGKAGLALGYPVVLVTIWAVDQSLSEAWSNDSAIERIIKPYIGATFNKPFPRNNTESQILTSKLPEPLRSALTDRGVDLSYVVYLLPADPEREESETTIVVFPLLFKNESNFYEQNVEDTRKFWKSQPSLLSAATILGQLAGTMRELAINRAMLFSAEQAVGIIGHEMRSPMARLGQISEQLCDQEFRLLDSMNEHGQIRTVTSISFDGKPMLTTLSGYSQIHSWLTERKARVVEYIEIGQRVVSDAIWWARMSGKKVEMDLKLVRLSNIIDMCIDELSKEIQEHSPLYIDVKRGVRRAPPFVADPVLLHTLIFNLLDNAIKYTHSRGDWDSVVTITAESQTNLVDIHITNWGLGIDRTDYNNIFSSFYRSKFRDRLHTVRGVGLGLATCRRIVRLHGGRIWVQSRPTLDDHRRTAAMEGFETTFSIRLPTTLKPGRVDVETDRYQMG